MGAAGKHWVMVLLVQFTVYKRWPGMRTVETCTPGGGFIFANAVEANGVACWDGAAWSNLGDGVGGASPRVFVLAWDAENGHLYAGGDFTSAGGNPASRIARWDGGDWWALGSGTNGAVSALAWDAKNRQLYAGGGFTSAGDQPARIARARIRQQTIFADDFEVRSD